MMDDEKDLGLGIGDWGMEERTGNGVRPSGEVRAGMREVGKAGHQALEAGECRNGGVVLGAKSTKTQKRRRKEREEREYEGWDEPWKANSQKSRMLTGLQGELLGLGLEKKGKGRRTIMPLRAVLTVSIGIPPTLRGAPCRVERELPANEMPKIAWG